MKREEKLFRLFSWVAILFLLLTIGCKTLGGGWETSWKRICKHEVKENAPVLSLPVDPRDVRYQYYGIWPFGIKDQNHPKGHTGIDFELKLGAKIVAAAAGRVRVVSKAIPPYDPSRVEYWIRIDHSSAYSLIYQHLGKVFVKSGEEVKKGQLIGIAAERTINPVSMMHFSLLYSEHHGFSPTAICPGPYFTEEGKKELLKMVLRSKYQRLCHAGEIPY